jgi:hypothetical protein
MNIPKYFNTLICKNRCRALFLREDSTMRKEQPRTHGKLGWSRLVAVVAIASAVFWGSLRPAHVAMAFVPPPPPYQDQVDSAVAAGRAWLLTQQAAGCWSSSGVTTGVTALAMLAIIHSVPTGYAGLDPASKAAVDAGTTCLLDHVITTPGVFAGTIDDGPGFLSTYNTSIAIWALSEVPSSAAIVSAIAGGRTWLIDNQRNCADPPGRADLGGNASNGGWFYENNSCGEFVEHSNSSFALQGLAASAGGIPPVTADLAQGYFTCLQRRPPPCGPSGFNPNDGGFIYSPGGPINGGSHTAASGSGTFALLLTGVALGDPRIVDAITFLDASLAFSRCTNNVHNNPPGTDLSPGTWNLLDNDTHYTVWANFKAHELAGIPPDLNNPSNYYFKLADCLTNEQAPDGHFPSADGREDDILATSFALLTLEKVAPGPIPGPTPIIHVRSNPTPRVREGGTAYFMVEADRVLMNPVTVKYLLSGNATLNSDYTLTPPALPPTPFQVTIPAGQVRTPVTLDAYQDGIRERRGESATMTIQPGIGYAVYNGRHPPFKTATIKILD